VYLLRVYRPLCPDLVSSKGTTTFSSGSAVTVWNAAQHEGPHYCQLSAIHDRATQKLRFQTMPCSTDNYNERSATIFWQPARQNISTPLPTPEIPYMNNSNHYVGRTIVSLIFTLLPFCFPRLLQALELQVVGATPTQVVVEYHREDSRPCRIEISESPNLDVLVNDVNPLLFPGSDTDSRAIVEGNRRTLVLGRRTTEASGRRRYSRALRADTLHYLRLTCPGAVFTSTFKTAPPSGLAPEAPQFLEGADGNMGVPDFDWSDRSLPIIDPQTGVAIYRIGDPRDFSSDTSHIFDTGADSLSIGFPDPIGAAPRVLNTATVGDPRTTLAALFLPIDSNKALTSGGWNNTGTQSHPITDLGIRVHGRGSGTTELDRTIDVCISIDSGNTCYTDSIPITMLNGAAQDLGVYPITYPNPIFGGWGKPVTRELFSSTGRVTVSGTTVTLTKDDNGAPINTNYHSSKSRFHVEWPPNAKIYIAGSSPICSLDYCTIETVSSQTQLTIRENLHLTEGHYRFAGIGFRVIKRTASGNVSFSATYRIAKSFILHQGAGSGCSTKTVTTTVTRTGSPLGRSITGRLCVFPMMAEGPGRLYFIGESEPEVRFLSLFREPTSLSGHITADLPSEGGGPNIPTFSEHNPNVFFMGNRTLSGVPAIFKLTYVGDYRENSAAWWTSRSDSTPGVGDANILWENLTKSATGSDLRTQVLAKSSYDESKWGTLTLGLVGFTSRHMIFITPPVAPEAPCWVFVFETGSGTYVRGWNTLNGGGEGSLAGGCHNVQVAAGRILVINNGLNNNNPTSLWGGPFDIRIDSVKRGSAFSSNTALPGSPDSSYDASCPDSLPDRWKQVGAVGDQCVTIRVKREPCSSVATMAERLYTPCPGDPTKSWVGKPMDVGQDFYDASAFCDNEHLMIVRRTNLPDGNIELVLLRDAAPGYCCSASNPRGRSCSANTSQAVHSAGWSLRMKPSGSCCSCTQVYDPSSGDYVVEEQTLMRGHFSYGLLASGNHTLAGIGLDSFAVRYDSPASHFGKRETATVSQWPLFAGAPNMLTRSLQSYIAIAGGEANASNRRYASDWRHPNGWYGGAAEGMGQTIGDQYHLQKVQGTTHVYKVSGISGFYHPKRTPLIGWVGRYILSERSSPVKGNTLTDNNAWRVCYSYTAGECRPSSNAGDVYVSAPYLDISLSHCHASQISYRSLCLFGGTPIFGQIMQMRIDQNDPSGLWQRRLGYGLTRPGSQYVYSKTGLMPDGQALMFTAFNLQGVYSLPVMMKLPTWPTDAVKRNTYVPVTVTGSGSAFIEFGYDEFGHRDNFFCTPRSEACRVTSQTLNEAEPFQYASEASAPATGTWTITIPALPGRVVYFRTVIGGVTGPTQALPIP